MAVGSGKDSKVYIPHIRRRLRHLRTGFSGTHHLEAHLFPQTHRNSPACMHAVKTLSGSPHHAPAVHHIADRLTRGNNPCRCPAHSQTAAPPHPHPQPTHIYHQPMDSSRNLCQLISLQCLALSPTRPQHPHPLHSLAMATLGPPWAPLLVAADLPELGAERQLLPPWQQHHRSPAAGKLNTPIAAQPHRQQRPRPAEQADMVPMPPTLFFPTFLADG